MKKVIIVSKTHLDLGFTDYAANIRKKYIDSFIPAAADTAAALNTDKKRFVWTTGSWIIKEALNNSTPENRQKLVTALKNGDIAPHAMPFTTHTELLDEDTLEYGMSIVDEIDKITGRKTTAAKMTDVPGHTVGLVHMLARHGIKLLHIGVNGASAMPKVPECFLWKQGGSEVVVLYSGAYGGEYRCPLTGDILYFDHTLDNKGANSVKAVAKHFDSLCKKYPDCSVTAGRLDDFADELWEYRSELPVIENEIGDTWIHGSAADPYKSGALRELIALKNEWLNDGSLNRDSDEYVTLADNLLCIAEHTCGMDVKRYLSDFENYLRPDFEAARKKDKVEMKHPLWGKTVNLVTIANRLTGEYKPGSYSTMEKSWQEQREYITAALGALSEQHRDQAQQALEKLMPKAPQALSGAPLEVNAMYSFGGNSIAINRFGGIKYLMIDGKTVIADNEEPTLQYHSYGKADYDFWLKHYTRNFKETKVWSLPDFARPLIEYVDGKYPHGRVSYRIKNGAVSSDENGLTITADFCISDICTEQLGAARLMQAVYVLGEKGLKISLSWFDKPANRLTESTVFRIYPNTANGSISFKKLGTDIAPRSVAENGGRNLSAVEKLRFSADGGDFELINRHAPLVSLGRGKILEFDNAFENAETDGIAYILHDNVWGTNFPLWYEDNAYFEFEINEI